MAEIQIPPQYVGQPEYPDPKDTEGHVAAAAVALAKVRVNQWTTFVSIAISEFESNANGRIEHLDNDDDDLTFSFNPVLASFAKVVKDFYPGLKEIKEAVDAISEVMNGIQSSYEEKLQSGLAGAKLRLHDLRALVQAARDHVTEVAPVMQDHLAEAVEDGMTFVDSASTNPEYVSELCDWMGFPEPTKGNTIVPVRQALENPFFGVYELVRGQLEKANPQNPIADTINPLTWQREAEETQSELFLEYLHDVPPHPEDAWNKVYEGVLPDRFTLHSVKEEDSGGGKQ